MQHSASASAAAASAHMPPKQKGKSGPKKKGAKDGPVKLDDKDLLRRAEIDIACLQSLLEVKSQEVCTFGTSAQIAFRHLSSHMNSLARLPYSGFDCSAA